MAKEHQHTYFLTAGETDAEGRMPLSLIFERVIEVATEHANSLDIGYAALIKHGIGWVLARMSVHMLHYPGINEGYRVTTWIESINRLYSNRCFEFSTPEGEVLGYVRTQWIAIDMQKRTAADLSVFDLESMPVSERRCPVEAPRKLPPFESTKQSEYTFKFTDIDFNRHVNTVQYVRILLNQWSLPFFDEHQVSVFDIAFHQECHFGDTVTIGIKDDGDSAMCEMLKSDGKRAVAAILKFENRENKILS